MKSWYLGCRRACALAPLLFTVAAAAPGEGWQVRTLVMGASALSVQTYCLPHGGRDWPRILLPETIRRGCDLRGATWSRLDAACSRGGRLRANGTVSPQRFDMIATRTGPVGANPTARVSLHLEGNRVGACAAADPSSTRGVRR